MNEQKRE